MHAISRRAYGVETSASSWEWVWEAGPYFARLSDLLEGAQHHAIFVGWQVDSRVPLRGSTFKESLLQAVRKHPGLEIYFLIWDHAYIYMMERELMQGRVWDDLHPRIHFIFDNRHPLGASHHEKIVLIDGKVALCGGIDVCDERWDMPDHQYSDPRRSLDQQSESHGPYHDFAVQVTGPVVGQLYRHVAERWAQVTDRSFPRPIEAAPPLAPGVTGKLVLLSRTQAKAEEPTVREVEFLFKDLISQARDRIVLEGQYFWSKKITDLLIRKMWHRPGIQIRITLADLKKARTLTRWMAAYELRLLKRLQAAAVATGADLIVQTPIVFDPHGLGEPRAVYVHSKIMIIDDRIVSVGSANLAARTFRVDTELNLTWIAQSDEERRQIRALDVGLERHWQHDTVRLRPILAAEELRQYRKRHPFLAVIPFQLFFDPKSPWLFWKKTHPILEPALLGLVWLSGVMLTAWGTEVFSAAKMNSPWVAVLATVTASAWALPVPIFVSSALGSLLLGQELATKAGVCGLWVSALIGYVWARLLPRSAGEYCRKAQIPIPRELRSRRFTDTLRVALDPRLSLRSKIMGFGVSATYLPWFALLLLLILPGALTLFVRVFHGAMK